jgi:lysophospholipase L1-like esterase
MLTLVAFLALQEDWDYTKAMKAVAARFKGREGVVLHVGDSISYANPYSGWAKGGQGKTKDDQEILRWMHAGKGDDTDGWHLASVDRPGNRSETAVSGIRADEWLAGRKSGIPPLADVLRKYAPRMVVLMLGTNDASAGRAAPSYQADMEKCVDAILLQAAIPILSTIPPHPQKLDLAKSYNVALRELAKARKLPLIDYEREILKRRPNDWNGTLMGKDDVHPTAGQGGATPGSEPTEENLRNSGYLLRGWLSVRKIAEVKARVLGASNK